MDIVIKFSNTIMRIKTIAIVVLVIIVGIILIKHMDYKTFNAMLALTVSSFIMGVLVGYPSKPKNLSGEFPDNDGENEKPNTLSDEDREYIN